MKTRLFFKQVRLIIAAICVSLTLAAPSFAIDVVNLSNDKTWYIFVCDFMGCDAENDPGFRLYPGGRLNEACYSPCDIYASPYEFANNDELDFGSILFNDEGLVGITENGLPVEMEAGR